MIKFRLITWLLVLCCPVAIWANTEYDSQYTPIDSLVLTVDLQDEDGIYLSPQVAFCVQTTIPGNIGEGRLICLVTTDTWIPVDSLAFVLTPGVTGKIRQQISFTLPAPGFYRVSVYAENGTSKTPPSKFNIGYNPEQIISPTDARADFADFWEKTLAGLSQVKPRYKMTLLKDKCSATKNMYHVGMYSFGTVKIEGYYTVPKKAGKHPAIIRFMGYAANPRFPDPDVLPEFCEFILSVRGQGIQKAENPYGEWIVYGLSDKDTYYYRGAYMDLIRGIDFLSSRPEVNPHEILAEGGSQGGAFTLAACALDKRIKAAAPRIPFLSDFRDYFRICLWPRSVFEEYLKQHPGADWEKIYEVLSYFDIKNLAGKITCPIIMGIGLQDETCPPHTNFAGYNQIKAEKKYHVYPNQKHSVDESWWLLRETFFRQAIR